MYKAVVQKGLPMPLHCRYCPLGSSTGHLVDCELRRLLCSGWGGGVELEEGNQEGKLHLLLSFVISIFKSYFFFKFGNKDSKKSIAIETW